MKLIGLIGGTSWYSTQAYYKMINEGVGQILGEEHNPELLIHSINIEVMRSQDWNRIRDKYLKVSRGLQDAGAEAIVICANTPHLVYDFVQPQIGIPILHIADATGVAASEMGLKKLGLLGNRPTMTGDFIPGVLSKNYGIQTIIPDDSYIDMANHYVSNELTMGKFTPDAKAFFMTQIDMLHEKGADGIILGCTELPLLIKPEEVDLPVLRTTDLHAKMAVNFILDL